MDDVVTKVEGAIRLKRAKEAQEARLTTTITSKEFEKYTTMCNHQSKRSSKYCSPEEWFTIHPVTIYKRYKHEEIFRKPPPQSEAKDEVEQN